MKTENFEKNGNKIETSETKEQKDESIERFLEKESKVINDAEKVFEKAEPGKLKKAAAGLLAAFSIFMGASSSFASGPEKKDFWKYEEKKTTAETFKPEKTGFDWNKFVDRIEISVGGEISEKPEISDENRFFEGFTLEKFEEVKNFLRNAVNNSNSAEEFFQFLSENSHNLDEQKKAIFLEFIGMIYSATYNDDMSEQNIFVKISDDAMFQAIKSFYEGKGILQTGMCGNIHVFMVKVTNELGTEAWVQDVKTPEDAHIFMGVVLEGKSGKQIVFYDYGTPIFTNTLNYKDSLGIAEKYFKRIDIFKSFVGGPENVLFSAESRASEKIKEAAEIKKGETTLEENLSKGKIEKENVFEIKISPEMKKVKLTKDFIALSFHEFKDNNNPYQSLEKMDAFSARFGYKIGEEFSIEGGPTFLHMDIKDFYGGEPVAVKELINVLSSSYVNSAKFNAKEYGKFILNFGATIQSVFQGRFEEINIQEAKERSVFFETIGGVRLFYLNPSETGKFYIGNSMGLKNKKNDFQEQKRIIKKFVETVSVGGEIKAGEGLVYKIDASGSDYDWGKRFSVKAGIEGKTLKGAVGLQKDSSDYARFVPDAEKISVEAGYKGGPKWEVDFMGFRESERYKDAKEGKEYQMEIKLKLFLW